MLDEKYNEFTIQLTLLILYLILLYFCYNTRL